MRTTGNGGKTLKESLETGGGTYGAEEPVEQHFLLYTPSRSAKAPARSMREVLHSPFPPRQLHREWISDSESLPAKATAWRP